MTVAELIAILQTKPQELLVAYNRYSECCLMEDSDVHTWVGGVPRPDGWIHHRRPDKLTQEYLVFPGN